MRTLILLASLCSALVGHGQEPCDVELTGTPLICPDDHDATLTVVANTPGQYTYYWSHDATLNAPTATGLTYGAYSVTVTDTSGCVSELDTVIVAPDVPQLGTMTATNISCAGANDGTLTFTVNPGPYTWEWTDDPTITSPVRTGLGPGSYGVVVHGGLCPSYVFANLGDPAVEISGNADYCPSDLPTLSAQLDWGFQPDVYYWSTGEFTPSINVVPGMNGLVTVTAIDTSIGCVVTDDITLTELPHPTVAFNPPDTLCIRTEATIMPTTSTADSLIWTWGSSGLSNAPNALVSFTDPYWQPVTLQGFDTLGCGTVPVEDSIYVRPRLPAIYTAEQVPCSHNIQLQLGSAADSCAFFVGDSLVLHACSGFYEVDVEQYGNYDLTFYSTQPDHCDDTLSSSIEVRTVPVLFLPTAFTPNNDGINDTWPGLVDIPDAGFEVLVFDRWGTILWSTKDTQAKWDGGGLPTGVYGYTMRMRDPCQPEDEIARNGIVTLLR
jgi:gliding motility-associated-like protein